MLAPDIFKPIAKGPYYMPLPMREEREVQPDDYNSMNDDEDSRNVDLFTRDVFLSV